MIEPLKVGDAVMFYKEGDFGLVEGIDEDGFEIRYFSKRHGEFRRQYRQSPEVVRLSRSATHPKIVASEDIGILERQALKTCREEV